MTEFCDTREPKDLEKQSQSIKKNHLTMKTLIKEKRHKCIACGTTRYERYMALVGGKGKRHYWQCGDCTETKHIRKIKEIQDINELIKLTNDKYPKE